MASSLFKAFSLDKIISGGKSVTSFVNKAIPIYKQSMPIVQNVRSAWNTVSSVRKAARDEVIKDIKAFERPVSHFKKKSVSDARGKLDIDGLTFFQ